MGVHAGHPPECLLHHRAPHLALVERSPATTKPVLYQVTLPDEVELPTVEEALDLPEYVPEYGAPTPP
jgi:hypothetical protein